MSNESTLQVVKDMKIERLLELNPHYTRDFLETKSLDILNEFIYQTLQDIEMKGVKNV